MQVPVAISMTSTGIVPAGLSVGQRLSATLVVGEFASARWVPALAEGKCAIPYMESKEWFVVSGLGWGGVCCCSCRCCCCCCISFELCTTELD